jgi:drug/metabolite transporter (DMT)-like permease
MNRFRQPGILPALGAALLFGASVPLAKPLSAAMGPWLLAGLLYLGSGLGLAMLRRWRGSDPVAFSFGDLGWLSAAVICGGIAGPVLLLWGLSHTSAAIASLLLNAEGALTVLIAWFVFGENFDGRIACGMLCILSGALVLAWPGATLSAESPAATLPTLSILAACLAWAIDNNLTRKIAAVDATFLAMTKGLVAGVTNVAIAFTTEASLPSVGEALAAAVLGFVSYGTSLVLFIVALRDLGSARTSAYFSIAPFVGALIAVPMFSEPLTVSLACAAALMASGVWLHVTERHAHQHTHEELEHEHVHVHDEHHQHEHDRPVAPGVRHTHRHRHTRITHAHPHFPDIHHRHRH